MQRTGASIAALTLLILAVVFQSPAVRDMAMQRAQQFHRQSATLVNSARSILSHYKTALPAAAFFFPSSAPNQQTHPTSQRPFTTSSSTMADSRDFLDATKSRRSLHQLTNESTISDARIKELVTHTIKHVPSAFNSQTTRLVVVLKEKHEELWDAILEVYKVQLPADKFEHMKGRVEMFRNAYGTILFYEDNSIVRDFQEKFKTYEDRFPQWSEHTSGMHQYTLWVALEAEGLGVNLQHYNPSIDTRLETMYDVPPTWSLKSQLVFGKPTAPPKEKTFKPVEERVKYFGD